MLNHWRLGEGKTVVLQHGFVGGSDYWAPQMASLGGMFDLIAPDMPGFAGSSGEPAADSIEGLAEALIGLLDGLGVDRFSLIGHSMGENTAAVVAGACR